MAELVSVPGLVDSSASPTEIPTTQPPTNNHTNMQSPTNHSAHLPMADDMREAIEADFRNVHQPNWVSHTQSLKQSVASSNARVCAKCPPQLSAFHYICVVFLGIFFYLRLPLYLYASRYV